MESLLGVAGRILLCLLWLPVRLPTTRQARVAQAFDPAPRQGIRILQRWRACALTAWWTCLAGVLGWLFWLGLGH